MFTILIVDDEKNERDGIRLLIEKAQFDLHIMEAENGEIALEIIRTNHIDILLTDIKMPFVDGLDLAEQATQVIPSLEIIIYSAYGKFDYARRALSTNASSYLLKPMEVDEFNEVMTRVIEKCRLKEIERIQAGKLEEGFQIGIKYEKDRALIELLHGATLEHVAPSLSDFHMLNANKPIVLILIDFSERFFDSHTEAFMELVREMLQYDIELLNLNERQSVLFIDCSNLGAGTWIKKFCENLATSITQRFHRYCCIVYGSVLEDWQQVAESFAEIEQTIDYKFFFDNNVVLFSEGDFSEGFPVIENIDEVMANIKQYIDYNDYHGAGKNIELLFNYLSHSGSSSAIYVKYLGSEIVKNIYEGLQQIYETEFKQTVESIFATDSIKQVKKIVLDQLTHLKGKHTYVDDTKGHIVSKVIKVIEQEYMHDIGLESIAESVSLNPSYLSHLFKRETGQSLIKYITMYRLEQAQKMLRETNLKIVDISEQVGYRSSSYFGLTFKTNYGVSPQKYRETVGDGQ